jgi:hypothetical protein
MQPTSHICAQIAPVLTRKANATIRIFPAANIGTGYYQPTTRWRNDAKLTNPLDSAHRTGLKEAGFAQKLNLPPPQGRKSFRVYCIKPGEFNRRTGP